jgi:hypothetical protein
MLGQPGPGCPVSQLDSFLRTASSPNRNDPTISVHLFPNPYTILQESGARRHS